MKIFNYIEIEINGKWAAEALEHFSDAQDGFLIFPKIFPRPLSKDPGISGSTMESSMREEWYLENWGSCAVYGCFKFSEFGNVVTFGFISEDYAPNKLVKKISETFKGCPINHLYFRRKEQGAVDGEIIRYNYLNGYNTPAEAAYSDGSLVKSIFDIHEMGEQKNIFTVLE
jgi:hypothetical protein